jgi:hypothetical protein
MKRTLLMIAVVIVATTAFSFAVTRWMALRCQGTAPTSTHDITWLKSELNLSDAQTGELEKAEAGFHTQLNSFCAAHCSARMALGDELAKSKPDPAKCSSLVEKMNEVQADAERVTLAHILKVRALLNEQQAQRYATIIHDQVCSLPMGTL